MGVADPLAPLAPDHLLQPVGVLHPLGQRLLQRLAISGRTGSNTESSSTNPRAWMSGPLTILAAWVLITAITEMNPSSPRIRRSFSEVSEMSPTVMPSTKM